VALCLGPANYEKITLLFTFPASRLDYLEAERREDVKQEWKGIRSLVRNI
jgi:hypothetical protein